MKFLVLGAGGVGGFLGAKLAADGNDVTFVARGPHREAMARDGLRLRSPLGDLHIERPTLFEDPSETGLCDVILLCTKLWDNDSAIELMRPLLAHDTAVISLQNGVEAEDQLADALGHQHVLGGVAQIAVRIAEPGVIAQTGQFARFLVGERDGTSTWRLEGLVAAGKSAGIDIKASDDIGLDLWKKFVLLTPFAGAACLFRLPIGRILADGWRREQLESLLAEAVAVGRAKGAALPDNVEARVMESYAGFPEEMKPSMLHDLEAGRRLEVDWLSGAVVRLGKALGVDTPASQSVVEALEPIKLGRAVQNA
ncbi:MAG: 2-dehydropantoate 2-reductase [Kiloniellales bacterium]|nr:2-dehydropantoate 2-reductase [Kiloniellales bacterium]